MIDEGGRAEPELRAVLAGGIHDAEVVLAVAEQHVFLALRELGDAAHQILNLVVSFPVTRRHQLKKNNNTHSSFSPTNRPFRNGHQLTWRDSDTRPCGLTMLLSPRF